MFPGRPSPRNGLPTSPRSRSIGRSMQEDSSSSYSSSRSEAGSSRTVRSQRSVNSISGRDRSEPPPMPSRYNNSSPLVSHRESDASSSSTVSTTASYFMDKLRAGYESPRTSLEDDFEPPKRGRRQESSQENRSSYQGENLNLDPRNYTHKPLRRLPRRRPCCARSWLFTLGKNSFCCRDSWC